MTDILVVFLFVTAFVYALFLLLTKLLYSKPSDFDRMIERLLKNFYAEFGVNERLTQGSFKTYAHGDYMFILYLDRKLFRHCFNYEGTLLHTVEMHYTCEADARTVEGTPIDSLEGPPR